MSKRGWLVNDTLTCIPNTKTFWHDLLEWLPNLEDKCNGTTPFKTLAYTIEKSFSYGEKPYYIIRNATYFRQINIPVKTISLLQDFALGNQEQLDVCNSSDVVVFNSPFTQSHYIDKITSKSVLIPFGVDFNKFKPLGVNYGDELGILPNSILFIGAATNTPKGFDIMMDIINNTNYNFCLVMKDDFQIHNPRVKVFNKIHHDLLVKVMNSCEMLVCTSRVETLHLSGVEAAATGLPLVTSNVGIYYDLENGVWGRNTKSFDYHDFIREIDYVKNNLGKFSPREKFLNLGLDTQTCKNKWIELVGSL
jgi:glycosyltransferase involved in cell wall biosynthesis